MEKPNDTLNSQTLSDIKKKFGDEAETYAQVRAEAAVELGSGEDKWEQLASKLRDQEPDGQET